MSDFFSKLSNMVTKPSVANEPEFLLLYGRPGGGKTYLAATISRVPGVNKVLIVDTEGSTVGTLNGFDDDKIDIVRVTDFATFNAVVNGLVEAGDENPYDAVIIDTFDVAQDWAIEEYENDGLHVNQRGDLDGFAVWRSVKAWTLRIANDLRNAPFKVVTIFHEVEDKQANGAMKKNIDISGAAKNKFPGVPDVVVYLERKVVKGVAKTVAYFETDDNRVTKNRFGFPPVWEDVSLDDLYAYTHKRAAELNTNTKENN